MNVVVTDKLCMKPCTINTTFLLLVPSVCVYLGDEDAVMLKQVMVVVATGQQLPDFSSEWLRNATANQ